MKFKILMASLIAVRVPLIIFHELFGLRKPKVLM